MIFRWFLVLCVWDKVWSEPTKWIITDKWEINDYSNGVCSDELRAEIKIVACYSFPSGECELLDECVVGDVIPTTSVQPVTTATDETTKPGSDYTTSDAKTFTSVTGTAQSFDTTGDPETTRTGTDYTTSDATALTSVTGTTQSIDTTGDPETTNTGTDYTTSDATAFTSVTGTAQSIDTTADSETTKTSTDYTTSDAITSTSVTSTAQSIDTTGDPETTNTGTDYTTLDAITFTSVTGTAQSFDTTGDPETTYTGTDYTTSDTTTFTSVTGTAQSMDTTGDLETTLNGHDDTTLTTDYQTGTEEFVRFNTESESVSFQVGVLGESREDVKITYEETFVPETLNEIWEEHNINFIKKDVVQNHTINIQDNIQEQPITSPPEEGFSVTEIIIIAVASTMGFLILAALTVLLVLHQLRVESGFTLIAAFVCVAFVGTSAFFGATGEIGWNVAGGLMGGTVALFAVFAVVMNICARFSSPKKSYPDGDVPMDNPSNIKESSNPHQNPYEEDTHM